MLKVGNINLHGKQIGKNAEALGLCPERLKIRFDTKNTKGSNFQYHEG